MFKPIQKFGSRLPAHHVELQQRTHEHGLCSVSHVTLLFGRCHQASEELMVRTREGIKSRVCLLLVVSYTAIYMQRHVYSTHLRWMFNLIVWPGLLEFERPLGSLWCSNRRSGASQKAWYVQDRGISGVLRV